MANKFYNENSFQYALDQLERNPYEAKRRFEEYIEKYPKDYYARAYYAITLTRLCLFDEAEMEYEYIKLKAQNDNFYACKHSNLLGFKYNMLIIKLKLLAHREDYKAIYELIRANKDLFEPNDIKFISYFCRIKLGLLTLKNVPTNSYRFMQTYNYSENLFREHIKKHLSEYNDGIEEPNPAIFAPDFPIDEIIETIKKSIPSSERFFPGYFDNTYYFKYDNCGRVNNIPTNYFVVVCFHNTTNFITMYPALDCQHMRPTKLDCPQEIECEEEKGKVKKLSQIEKFNKRFNRG